MKQILCTSVASLVVSFLLLLLSSDTVHATRSHDHSIRPHAPGHHKRCHSRRRALLGGQITVGGLLNVSVSAGDPTDSTSRASSSVSSTLPSTTATSTTPTSTSKPRPKPKPASSGCFPMSSSGFGNGSVPGVLRKDWWCKDEEMYGFLGFSYPLEISDCADPSNQYDKIARDLKRMKEEFGATFVRPYAVECRSVSVWENLVKACVENGLGLIAQVWWGFQEDQSLWKQGQASLYDLFERSPYAKIAPYVVYSASFGSEPIGDWVDGDDFVQDLSSFRVKMNSFGIPVGISEDWDRPNRMRVGAVVADMGSAVLNETDVAQLHVMPYYHPDEAPSIDDAWSYTKQQVQWARKALKQPTMITESMWSSKLGGSHGRGAHDDQSTLANYQKYWSAFSDNCEFFKREQTGYFVHTFDDSQEPACSSFL
ncbi:hypothetical protein JCM10212_007068 [Sporobolomyces blumeae]